MTWHAAVAASDHALVEARGRHLPRYSLAGSTGALALGCAAFTPSLLPRSWFWQGFVDGMSALFGYAFAVLVAWLVHSLTGWRPGPMMVRRLWWILAVVAVPLLVYTLWLGQHWQREVHLLTGTKPTPSRYAWIAVLLMAMLVLAAGIGIGRAVRRLVRRVRGWLYPHVPDRLASPLSVVAVGILLLAMGDGLLVRGPVAAAGWVFARYNDGTNAGAVQPLAPQRSGSPASLLPWSTLGRQGRDFVGRGPTRAQLSAFSGHPAQEPVRIYAGVESAPTMQARAALAVRDLERAGGFRRAVLVVATATGTGLVDPEAAASLEYMYDGDTAMVSMQYSVMPSFISLLTDHQEVQQAGRILFDRVYSVWSRMPVHHRPRLLVTGISLGAYGSEAAFTGLRDIERRTDGAVWVGLPHADTLHSTLVDQRDPGSPAWLPVYDQGRTVRFAGEPGDLQRPSGPWRYPRVVYLQNGSDPVVVWTPRLLWSEPAWLRGNSRPPDVSPDMFWIPAVTFWQVTADLPSTYEVTPGHGHHYRELYADAWAAVAAPRGWTAHDTERLRVLLGRVTY